jgi:hypothetical protein
VRGARVEATLLERVGEGLMVAAHGRGDAHGRGRAFELGQHDPGREPQALRTSMDELSRARAELGVTHGDE